jgi:predicted metal-dependent phosphoesterase TrpH
MDPYLINPEPPNRCDSPQIKKRYEAPAITSVIDLHTHTHYSDGRASPSELVSRASWLGIKILAITDHDTMQGVREALPLAKLLGMELIPAVEFTCRWDACLSEPDGNTDIDILGYFLDIDNPALRAFEQAAMADIHTRISDCCRRLTNAGYPVSMDEVLAWNPRYGGTMFLIDTIAAKGYAKDFTSAAALCTPYLNQGVPCRHTIQETISAIRSAGGVAVLAHPILVRCDGNWLTEEMMERLVAMGLQGVEVYHFRMTDYARVYFLNLARHFNLVVTGGSDDHGWPQGFRHLGHQPVKPEIIETLRSLARQNASSSGVTSKRQ